MIRVLNNEDIAELKGKIKNYESIAKGSGILSSKLGDDRPPRFYPVILNLKRCRFGIVKAEGVVTNSPFIAKEITYGRKGTHIRRCETLKESLHMLKDSKLFFSNQSCGNSYGGLPYLETQYYSYAYTDGSYNHEDRVYGWGGFIDVGGIRHIVKGKGNNPVFLRNGSMAGELFGVMDILAKAKKLGVKELIIYHDFAGISDYLTDGYAKGNDLADDYVNYVKKVVDDGMVIILVKIKSHSGSRGNMIADSIAKSSIGLKTMDYLPADFYHPGSRYRDFTAESGGTVITKEYLEDEEDGENSGENSGKVVGKSVNKAEMETSIGGNCSDC